MKHLKVHTPTYRRLQKSYGHWLEQLNFEPSTIHYSPIKLAEFLNWLETHHITQIHQITRKHTTTYFEYLKKRKNQKKGGTLSKNYLRTHLQTLRKFARYLRETGQDSFEISVCLPGTTRNIKTILTTAEIKHLYQSITPSLLGMRDQAMLAIYYGCGLRRSEGAALAVSDIQLDKNLVHVRKGKNYKERYVPISGQVKEHLQDYLQQSRPALQQSPQESFFIGKSGKPLSGTMLNERFKTLLQKAEIDKPAGLHTLRHSIATHLLQRGMKLEQISHFLGHSSLQSTQIYTHIAHEL